MNSVPDAPPARDEEGPVSPVPPSPPPPGQQGVPDTASWDPSATVISAASHADLVKYARGPAVLQRPQGPSLLTQALATARGIPRHNQSDPASLQEPIAGDTEGRNGDSLTPRSSPRKTTMPHSTTTSTTVAAPAYGLDLGEVNSMLSGHREFLTKTKGRNGQLDSPERDRPGRWNTYSHGTTSNGSVTSPLFTDSPTGLHEEPATDTTLADARPQPRTWKTDHRVSVVPEKAWSIGSGEAADDQDGQVEKSITEVLAGVEPNARSRKASHSLRFFKEGLPEEKGKRKEHRVAHPTRDKSPVRGEKLADIEEQALVEEKVKAQGLEDSALPIERKDWTPAIPTRTPEIRIVQGPPKDYFVPGHGDVDIRDAATEPALPRHKVSDQKQKVSEFVEPSCQVEPRRLSDVSVETGESAEEGEESGEEKISSAVFLPHQAPEEAEELSPMPRVPQRVVPTRRESRNEDFHPWLVKADEPEVVDKREIIDEERRIRPEAAQSPSVAPEVAFRQVDESAPVDESEAAILSPLPSRPLSQYHEETIHEHQSAPKQPLDAIELIPYKHQVGGHTTIWRFSRRAVCKQLNNRENEFYEKIEKYHRDLLAFLPRWVPLIWLCG